MQAAEPKNAEMLQEPSAAQLPSSVAVSLRRALPAAALVCALLVVWIVQHPSVGFTHDARIYLIQALARLNPELFAQDIFLRYGSQDRFTLFSPVFAAGMRLLGIESAAPTVAFLGQAVLVAAIVVLARMLMPARFIWLALGLVFAVPAFYGPGHIFELVEDFVTPRPFAEAAVIAALAAFLSRRFRLAAVLALVGLTLHPLMTASGVLVALCTNVTPPRVRALAIAAGSVGVGALFVWLTLHGHQLQFDLQWLLLLRAGLWYLWPSNWPVATWTPMLVTLSTLVIGMLTLERSHARSLCTACLIAAVAGVALTYVGADILRMVLVVQAQPYRVLWVATLMALMLMPLIMSNLWGRALFGRAAVVLLAASWLCMMQAFGIVITVLALLAAVAAGRTTRPLPPGTQRLVMFGAYAVLALAAIYHIADLTLFVEVPEFASGPTFLRDIRTASRTGALPVALLVLVYFAVSRFRSRSSQLGIAAACLAMLAALLPASAKEWTTHWYGDDVQAFAEWRALIPPGTEVLWFDAPVSTWMLLQRPSYLSNMQETSGLFSRPAAMAMKDRVNRLESYLATEPEAAWRDNQMAGQDGDIMARVNDPVPLAPLCAAAPDLRFIVTRKNMMAPPLAAAPATASMRYRDYQIYRCDPPHG